jgi:hypothetical protein
MAGMRKMSSWGSSSLHASVLPSVFSIVHTSYADDQVDAPLNVPPVEIGGYTLSAVPSADRDYLPLYGYGTSHESSSNINTMDRERTSGETARSDVVKRQTVMGWTGCPQGCGCKCRVAPVERELDEL